jgi:endonuclease YncB( thermonuclease family)
MFSPEGIAAKAFVVDVVTSARGFYIHSTRQEKYGRWLCEFYFERTDAVGRWVNLNDLLMSNGHARRYSHGRAVGVGLGTR